MACTAGTAHASTSQRTGNARYRRNETFAPSDAKFGLTPPATSNEAAGMAPQHRPAIRIRGAELRYTYARSSSSGSGSPAAAPTAAATASRTSAAARIPEAHRPRPIPCTAQEQPGLLGPDLCFGSGGDAVSAPNAASGNGRRGRRRLGTGRRGAGSGARVLARRRIPGLLRREGMNGKSWSRGATRSELGRGEEKNSGEHGAARVMRACREKPASVF